MIAPRAAQGRQLHPRAWRGPGRCGEHEGHLPDRLRRAAIYGLRADQAFDGNHAPARGKAGGVRWGPLSEARREARARPFATQIRPRQPPPLLCMTKLVESRNSSAMRCFAPLHFAVFQTPTAGGAHALKQACRLPDEDGANMAQVLWQRAGRLLGVEAQSLAVWDVSSDARLHSRMGLAGASEASATCAAVDPSNPDTVVCGNGRSFQASPTVVPSTVALPGR